MSQFVFLSGLFMKPHRKYKGYLVDMIDIVPSFFSLLCSNLVFLTTHRERDICQFREKRTLNFQGSETLTYKATEPPRVAGLDIPAVPECEPSSYLP